MKIKLFTHSDLDGIGCAVLARNVFDEADVIFCDYHNVDEKVMGFFGAKEYQNYDMIFITDISVTDEVARKINEVATTNDFMDKIWLLDHHNTAKNLNIYHWACVSSVKVVENYIESENKHEIFEQATSGTSMYYDFLDTNAFSFNENKTFLGSLPTNKKIELMEFSESVRRWDTWDWKNIYNDTHAKDLNNLLYLLGRERFVNRFSSDPDIAFRDEEQLLINLDKEAYKRYKTKVEKTFRIKDIFDHRIGVAFASRYTSELGNDLAEKYSGLDFIALIDMEGQKVSYRGVKDTVDLGLFARIFGGGGHPKAAGSMISSELSTQLIDKYFKVECDV